MRFSRIRHPRATLNTYPFPRIAGTLMRALVNVIPPAAILLWGFFVFIGYVNHYLLGAAPLVSQELSKALRRPVHIDQLTPDLTFTNLWSFYENPQSFASLPIAADGVRISTQRTTYIDDNGKKRLFDEPKLTNSRFFAKARRVTIFISLPTIMTGDVNSAITEIKVEAPELFLARSVDGRLNAVQIIPPKTPLAPPGPTFRSIVNVVSGRVQFTDYASSRAKLATSKGIPDRNAMSGINALVDLTGSRDFRFDISGRAAPQTLTTTRLGGEIRVWGTWGRADVGERFDAPEKESARFLIQARAHAVDIPYWYYYFVNAGLVDPKNPSAPEPFHFQSGKMDVEASLAGPRAFSRGSPIPGISINIGARFSDGAISTGFAPVSLGRASGDFVYNDGTVSFAASAAVLNRAGRTLADAVQASGSLWSLTLATPNAVIKPELAILVHSPHVSLTPLVQAVIIDRGLPIPPGLTVAGDVSVDTLVTGTMPDVAATGTFSGAAASFTGFPAVRNVTAAFTYAAGLINVTKVGANIDGGGTAVGRATVRMSGGSDATVGAVQFSASARDIQLSRISSLSSLTERGGDPRTRLAGIGDVDAVGRRVDGALSIAANVSARGLRLGQLAFSVARARVLVNQSAKQTEPAISIAAARIESTAGALAVGGEMGQHGALNIRWTADSLDLASLSRAFGAKNISGMVTASGTLSGTANDPRAVISDIVGLNLRMGLPGATPSAPPYHLAADVLRARNVVISRRGIALNDPVVIRRFPAAVYIVGTATDVIPVPGHAFNPGLDITAKVDNLEFAEIERQLQGPGDAIASGVHAVVKAGAVADTLAIGGGGALPVSGEITTASLTARGKVSVLQVDGSASLGRLLVKAGTDANTGAPIEYPLDSGSFDFSYNPNRMRITNAAVLGSIGELTGSATLLRNGSLAGSLRAPALDTGRLAFLTKRYFSLDGKLSAAATVGGTLSHPYVVAQIGPSDITVAGLPIVGLAVHDLTYTDDVDSGRSRIVMNSLSFLQGRATIEVGKSLFELPTNRFETDVRISTDDIGGLIDVTRTSGLRDSEVGLTLVNSLDRLQAEMPTSSGVTEAHLQIAGRIATTSHGDGKSTARMVDGIGEADVSTKDLKIGQFTAPSVTAHATLAGEEIKLDNLAVDSPGATIRASGTYNLDGDINVLVESNGAKLDTIRAIPALAAFPLSGVIDLTAQLTGSVDKPTVTASFQGNDIDYEIFSPDQPLPVSIFPAGQHAFSLVRGYAQYKSGEDGLGTITITDALVEHGNDRVSLEGTLPISRKSQDPRLRDQNVSMRATAEGIDLADFKPLFEKPVLVQQNPRDKKGKKESVGTSADLGGKVAVQLTLGGPNGEPVHVGDAKLGGYLTVTDAHFQLPRDAGNNNDAINPIRSLNAKLTLSGDQINVDTLALVLDGPNKTKGNFGSVTVGGNVRLSSLVTLQRILTPRAAGASDPNVRAVSDTLAGDTVDLTAKLIDLRPVEDNLFNFGETVTAKINGTLRITGPLNRPTIDVPDGGAIHLGNPQIKLSSRTITTAPSTGTMAIMPQFGSAVNQKPIQFVIDGKASLSQPGTFSFDASGSGTLGGSMAPLTPGGLPGVSVLGNLDVLGGSFSLPTTLFRVQRGGVINISYSAQNPSILAENVTAVARRYDTGNTNIANYAGSSNVAQATTTSAIQPVSGASNSYDITVTLNGPILLFPNANGAGSGRTLNLTFSGVERATGTILSEKQCIAIIGSQQQADLASQGHVQEAVNQISQQVLYNSVLPTYLAPVTDVVQNWLGLSNFSADYNPEGYANIFAQRRLPDPFSRFIIEYQQQIRTTAAQLTQQQPYTFSFAYDLFHLAPLAHIQPRMQTGFSDDDQHVFTYFLRGTVTY